MNAPRFDAVRPGATIALIAPSSPFDGELYEKGRSILLEAGYRIAPGKSISNKRAYLAGTDVERAHDLMDAILDPEVQAVLCVRGGYGSGRLLPWLHFPNLRKHPKILIGHSDVTFLHLALISQAGWTTFHGPNLTGLAQSAQRARNVLDALSGTASYLWPLEDRQILRRGLARGPMAGGNLTCLAHLVGTPYLPDLTGALLLIEDCNEALYRLDRIMNHLKLAGILSGLGGVLLGEFTGCAEESEICSMVMEHVAPYDYPVVCGLPFGHGDRNDVIPLGAPFLLDTRNERTLRVLDPPVAS
ncbi:MAG: LD-carboxypeptidase [Desulfobacteraceae bacterium]|nr:LD-carboxypeptidase [Desulfobacteraceae bacterium]